MAIAQFTVVPVGTSKVSISEYVAEAVKAVSCSGLKYRVDAMGTEVEGDLQAIFDVAKQMHEACFSMGVERVVTAIILDDRRDKTATMESKIKSVSEKVGLDTNY
jgi:uncharacterized protein (TIGR00106 family)